MCSLPVRQLLDLSRSFCMHCFPYVLHISFILSSIASCFITFMHLYRFLVSLDHLYVSPVKLYNFLYPLSVMTKRERKCGFFLRFYMLGGEIYAFIRGSCVSSCQGEHLPPCCFSLLVFVHRSCDHFYIHCGYLIYIYIYI